MWPSNVTAAPESAARFTLAKGPIVITKDSPRISLDPRGNISMADGPFFHPDASIDIAAFRASGIAEKAHYIPLGAHLDDWIGRGDFELSEAIILGYPPIPFTLAPILVAVRAEVNAVVDPRGGGGPHFIFSAMPRGGFSGGVAISEWNFAFGVVTQSLFAGDLPSELGYFATTSIEAVFNCLAHNKILPECQKEGWDGLWDDYPPHVVSRVE
jgi:hypothetical protein